MFLPKRHVLISLLFIHEKLFAFSRAEEIFDNNIMAMAESVRESSGSSDDSLASYVLSSNSVTSSAASSSQGKRKTKRSISLVAKSMSQIKNGKDSALNNEEMEALVSWIFSSKESNKVETKVRATLVDDPRIKLEPARIKVVEHILDIAQKHLFELLIAGFCRKFSTLVKEAFDSKEKNKKAAFVRTLHFTISSKRILSIASN